MTDITAARYIQPDNSQVFVEPQGWYMPQPCNTYHQGVLDQWLAGKSDQWVADEAAYNSYRAIMDYDPAVLDPETSEPYTPPQGWNSQEDVDASQAAWDSWREAQIEWDADPENNGEPYPVPEPTILLSPSELPPVDPPVPAEGDLNPNQISEYYEYFNWTVEQAQAVKYGESDSYADELIDEANANPYVGYTTTPKKNKQRVAQRTKHNTNGKPPSDTDKDRDENLADREDEILDANDLLHDFIEAGTDVDEIMAVDIKTIVNWGSWTPSP